MGPLGFQEMIFIFVFALVIFGPKKLPELGRTFGKGMAEFRRASNELKGTFQREMDNIERETRVDEARKAASEANKALKDATTYYDGEDDYYDEYDYDSSAGKSASSSKEQESAPSTGASSDGDAALASAETLSSDGSSPDASTEPKPVESAKATEASPAPEQSTA